MITENNKYQITFSPGKKEVTRIYTYTGKDMGGAYTFVNDKGIFKTKNLDLIKIQALEK
jgi:hypothetical protein